jgi:hypothetical protein
MNSNPSTANKKKKKERGKKWIELKSIMSNGISQTQKDKTHMFFGI